MFHVAAAKSSSVCWHVRKSRLLLSHQIGPMEEDFGRRYILERLLGPALDHLVQVVRTSNTVSQGGSGSGSLQSAQSCFEGTVLGTNNESCSIFNRGAQCINFNLTVHNHNPMFCDRMVFPGAFPGGGDGPGGGGGGDDGDDGSRRSSRPSHGDGGSRRERSRSQARFRFASKTEGTDGCKPGQSRKSGK